MSKPFQSEAPDAMALDPRVTRLIVDLRGEAAILRVGIKGEEERCNKFDPTEVGYPSTAKAWGQRLHNLQLTIRSLESIILAE